MLSRARTARRLLPAGTVIAVWLVTRWLLIAALPDQVGLDGVMDLTHGWSSLVLHGHDPYASGPTAYPPLAMFGFAAINPLGFGPGLFRYLFAYGILAVDFAGLLVAAAAQRRGVARSAPMAYALVVALMGPVLLLWRYDLVPAVLTLAALAALASAARVGPGATRARTAAWLLLGIAVALKPYGLVLVPLFAVDELRSRRDGAGASATRVAVLLAPSLVAGLAMLPLAGSGWLDVYGFQASRALTADATPAQLLVELSRLGLGTVDTHLDGGCACLVRTGSAANALRLLFTVVVATGVAAIAVRTWRALRWTNEDARAAVTVNAGCAALALLVLAYPVFSPQYVVWVIVPLVLLADRPAGRVALGAGAVAAALAAASYPRNIVHVERYDALGRALLLGRSGALLITVCAALYGMRSSRDAHLPVDPVHSQDGRNRPGATP